MRVGHGLLFMFVLCEFSEDSSRYCSGHTVY
nr:MAG TPA: hypothetical protein [Herelleviridae sp.]